MIKGMDRQQSDKLLSQLGTSGRRWSSRVRYVRYSKQARRCVNKIDASPPTWRCRSTDGEIYSRLYAMSSHIAYSYGEYTPLSPFRDKDNNPDAVSFLRGNGPRAHQPSESPTAPAHTKDPLPACGR